MGRERAVRPWVRLVRNLLILAAIILLILFSLDRGAKLFRERNSNTRKQESIVDLWNQGRYSDVAKRAESTLQSQPINQDALLFAGYSRYYTALSRLSEDERSADLNRAIRYLRLLLAQETFQNSKQVYYILGKAYLMRGVYWADLSVKYLLKSLEEGYSAEDTDEFLGKAYALIGNYEEALIWYTKAAEKNSTDRILITMGETAFNLGRYDEAAAYYKRAVDETRDESLKIKGLSQLGKLYYDVGNYSMAVRYLETLVETDPRNEDGLFLLGESYYELGIRKKARQSWLAVTRINPKHVGALRRLYD